MLSLQETDLSDKERDHLTSQLNAVEKEVNMAR